MQHYSRTIKPGFLASHKRIWSILACSVMLENQQTNGGDNQGEFCYMIN